jgi:hypothetical protein
MYIVQKYSLSITKIGLYCIIKKINIIVGYDSSELVSNSACSFLLEVLRDINIIDQYKELDEMLLMIKWYVI